MITTIDDKQGKVNGLLSWLTMLHEFKLYLLQLP